MCKWFIITSAQMWWNGIHSGLKIRRRKLEGSNPSICTKIRVFLTRIFFCSKCLKPNGHKAFLKFSILT